MIKPDLRRRRVTSEYDEDCGCEVLATYIDAAGDHMLADEVDKALGAMQAEIERLKARNKHLEYQAELVDALNDVAYSNGYDFGKKEMSKEWRKDADESIESRRTEAVKVIKKAKGENHENPKRLF